MTPRDRLRRAANLGAQFLVGAAVLALVVACGEGSQRPETEESKSASPAPSGAQAKGTMELGCESTWRPTKRGLPGPGWERTALRLGPVALLGAGDLHRLRFRRGSAEIVKIPLLVDPRRPMRIEIDSADRSAVGFVAFGGAAGVKDLPPDADAVLDLDGCPAVPPAQRAFPELGSIGYPSFWFVERPRCIGITVRPSAGTTQRGRVGIGTRCRSTAA